MTEKKDQTLEVGLGIKYEMPDEAIVAEIINSSPVLIELLSQAYEKAEAVFGENPHIVLTVDSDDTDPRLTAFIVTNLAPQQAVERLDRFDEWWIKNKKRANHLLSFDIDFK